MLRAVPLTPLFSLQWIRFEDLNGPGFAQPDAWLVRPDALLLFECKLTETPRAIPQLLLYEELLQHIYRRPVVKVQVCKNLRRGTRRQEVDDLSQAFRVRTNAILTWQWLP